MTDTIILYISFIFFGILVEKIINTEEKIWIFLILIISVVIFSTIKIRGYL